MTPPRTITHHWLTQQAACAGGQAWLKAHAEGQSPTTVVRALMEDEHLDWASWLLVRCMTYPQYVAYAVFAAEQVITIYERQYPQDSRPRKAIEAATLCLTDSSEKNKHAAESAAWAAAWAAAGAARDAGAAARAKMQRRILNYGIALLTTEETR